MKVAGRGWHVNIGAGPFHDGTEGNGQVLMPCVAPWHRVQVILVMRDIPVRSRADLRSVEWKIVRMFFQTVGSGEVLAAEILYVAGEVCWSWVVGESRNVSCSTWRDERSIFIGGGSMFTVGCGSTLMRRSRDGLENQIVSSARRSWVGGMCIFATMVAICSCEGVVGKSMTWKVMSLNDQMRWLRRVVRSSGVKPCARKVLVAWSGVAVVPIGVGGVTVIKCIGVLLQMADKCIWRRNVIMGSLLGEEVLLKLKTCMSNLGCLITFQVSLIDLSRWFNGWSALVNVMVGKPSFGVGVYWRAMA